MVNISRNSKQPSAPKPLDDMERLLTLQLAIKAADLGHLGEDLEVHKRRVAGGHWGAVRLPSRYGHAEIRVLPHLQYRYCQKAVRG